MTKVLAGTTCSSKPTARVLLLRSLKVSFSDTPRGPSPGPTNTVWDVSSWPTAAPFSSTRLATYPPVCRPNCCRCSRSGKIERVGESTSTEIDARIIAATNKDLLQSVKSGQFRQDLFYRLEMVTINIPPLRERLEDIPLLVNNINASESERMNRPAPIYTDDAINALCQYNWPGNVRELKNMVKRLIILQPGALINENNIKRTFPVAMTATSQPNHFTTLEQAERAHIIQALTATGGVVGGKNGAARLLDIPRSTLQYRMKKLKLNPLDYDSATRSFSPV